MIQGQSIQPEDLLHFLELPQFTRRWAAIGLDDEKDLLDLQLTIMLAPKSGRVIRGTSGLRKLRFAPRDWSSGKSGALRVLYVYFPQFYLVLLCLVYDKTEQDDLSMAAKGILNKAIATIETELARRWATIQRKIARG